MSAKFLNALADAGEADLLAIDAELDQMDARRAMLTAARKILAAKLGKSPPPCGEERGAGRGGGERQRQSPSARQEGRTPAGAREAYRHARPRETERPRPSSRF